MRWASGTRPEQEPGNSYATTRGHRDSWPAADPRAGLSSRRTGKTASRQKIPVRECSAHESELPALGHWQERTGNRDLDARPEPTDRAGLPGGPGMLLPGPTRDTGHHAAHTAAGLSRGPAVVRPSLPDLPPCPDRRGRSHIRHAGPGRCRGGGTSRRPPVSCRSCVTAQSADLVDALVAVGLGGHVPQLPRRYLQLVAYGRSVAPGQPLPDDCSDTPGGM